MGANSFLSGNVMHIRLSDSKSPLVGGAATGTFAALFNRGEVVGIATISKIQCSRRHDGISESLGFVRQGRKLFMPIEKLTAVRVGHTQSNMSAPKATETTRSSGYPYL